MVIPACWRWYLLLVVGQREPGLLTGDDLAGLRAGEHRGHVVLVPPVGPPGQPAVRAGQAAQERQELLTGGGCVATGGGHGGVGGH